MRGLSGKAAIVTGAASGIGLAIARRLAEEGMAVGMLDVNEEGLEAAREGLRAEGRTAYSWRCDITDYENVRIAIAEAESALGVPWLLVNNAGWDTPTRFVDTGPEFWDKVIRINFYGPIHVTHAVLQRMRDRGGRIVFIASDAGRVGSTGEVVYSGCKGGTIAFAKALARETAQSNVLVNCVCPGPTDTPAMEKFVGTGKDAEKLRNALIRAIPLGRIGEPKDYPGIVAFLASEDASFITGQTISVSGGLTMHG